MQTSFSSRVSTFAHPSRKRQTLQAPDRNNPEPFRGPLRSPACLYSEQGRITSFFRDPPKCFPQTDQKNRSFRRSQEARSREWTKGGKNRPHGQSVRDRKSFPRNGGVRLSNQTNVLPSAPNGRAAFPNVVRLRNKRPEALRLKTEV